MWHQIDKILLSYKYIKEKMAKKVNKTKKTVHRLTVAERTIEEGRDFVERSTRIRIRRTVGTRTMKEIAGSRVSGLRTKNKKQYKDIKKNDKPKTKEIKKHTSSARHPKTVTPAKPTVPVSIPIAPVGVTGSFMPDPAARPVVRTGSRASSVGKVAKLAKSSSMDKQIPSFGFIDVCFCVDSTGSMSGQLAQVQEVIKAIISNIENKVRTEGLQLRFAIVSYRDHPPQDSTYVTNHLDFTDQFEAINYVKTLTANGGGDEPEAAHDGLMLSAKKLRWAEIDGTPTLRYIFHIADAAPHGSQFGNMGETKTGCLCGLQTDDVIREINKKSIHYRLIKARTNPRLDTMQRIFKQKMGNFDSTDIGHARQLNVKVSDMIIHQVLPDYA